MRIGHVLAVFALVVVTGLAFGAAARLGAGEPVEAVDLSRVDIALAVEGIYPAADYRRADSYAELQRTWRDARRIPTEQELKNAWDARQAAAAAAADTRRAAKQAVLAKLGLTTDDIPGLVALIQDGHAD